MRISLFTFYSLFRHYSVDGQFLYKRLRKMDCLLFPSWMSFYINTTSFPQLATKFNFLFVKLIISKKNWMSVTYNFTGIYHINLFFIKSCFVFQNAMAGEINDVFINFFYSFGHTQSYLSKYLTTTLQKFLVSYVFLLSFEVFWYCLQMILCLPGYV